jgi:hypothetical protein
VRGHRDRSRHAQRFGAALLAACVLIVLFVGVGDSIAYAKRRLPGLLCGRDGFREAYCAGLAGPRLLLIEGNPIRSIAVSGDLCWPDVSGLTPDARSCAETVRELRQVKG